MCFVFTVVRFMTVCGKITWCVISVIMLDWRCRAFYIYLSHWGLLLLLCCQFTQGWWNGLEAFSMKEGNEFSNQTRLKCTCQKYFSKVHKQQDLEGSSDSSWNCNINAAIWDLFLRKMAAPLLLWYILQHTMDWNLHWPDTQIPHYTFKWDSLRFSKWDSLCIPKTI